MLVILTLSASAVDRVSAAYSIYGYKNKMHYIKAFSELINRSS
jgi:hypothetical protein